MVRVSGNYGSGKKYRLLRKELEVVLMNRYMVTRSGDGIILEEERRNMALCIIDALFDLQHKGDLSEIVEALEISGVLSPSEARHFLGIGSLRQSTLEEAVQPPLPGLTAQEGIYTYIRIYVHGQKEAHPFGG